MRRVHKLFLAPFSRICIFFTLLKLGLGTRVSEVQKTSNAENTNNLTRRCTWV